MSIVFFCDEVTKIAMFSVFYHDRLGIIGRMTEPTPEKRMPPSPRGSIREMVRDPLNFFLGLTRQYGDIVCYRPAPDTAYLINHPDFIRHVLVDNNRNYSKDTYSNQVFKKVVGDGLVTSEGETWRWQRRLMQPAFHHTRLEALEPMIVEAALGMLERWERSYAASQPIDIAREMASLTLTITTRALFGIDLGEEVNAIGEWVNQAANQFEKPSHPQVQESARAIRATVERIVQERRRDFTDKGDLLSSLMLAHEEGSLENGAYTAKMNDAQLADQVMTLLIAGYETTANALTWTWYLLSQNPASMSRLRQEVREHLGDRLPKVADLEEIPFIRMVFDESLRLYPPAWMIGRRAIGADRLGGYDVPPNTVIAICAYTVHRHPEFWDEPETFNPERFSDSPSRPVQKFAYIPFGAGPRQCIGNNFGLLEASLILACAAQHFEMHLAEGSTIQPQPLFVLRPNRDLMMVLSK
jgi:cytochrome P450